MTDDARTPTAASSFDRANWLPGTARTIAGLTSLAFAAVLWRTGGFLRFAALAMAADTGVALLPWRYPRSDRTAVSIWTEAVLYLTGPSAVAVVAVTTRQPWLIRMPAPWWWPAGIAVAAMLIGLGGVPLLALVRGDLAGLGAAVTRRHKLARCLSTAGAPPGEEALYRAPLLAVHGLSLLPAGLLGAAAFVARHHAPPGMHERTTGRVLATQVAGAAALGLLTWASRSVYPALLAHALNNGPGFLLEAGRPTRRAQPEDMGPEVALRKVNHG